MSEHVLEHLSAYLDGALGAPEQERFRAHLAECASCARRLEQLASVDAALRELPDGAPAGYFEELPARVRARVAASRRPERRFALPAFALAAAAALVLAVIVPLTLQRGAAPASVPAPAAKNAPAAVPSAAPASETDRFARAEPAAAPAVTLAPARAANGVRDEVFRQDADKTRTLRARNDALQKREEPAHLATPTPAPPAAPPPPAGAVATAERGYAEPPRQTAQAAQQSGPRANQQEARVQTAAEEVQVQGRLTDARAGGKLREAESKDAAAPAERTLAKTGEDKADLKATTRSAFATSQPSARFRELRSRTAPSAAAARSLRDSWRAFARDAKDVAEADEARVRVIELGIEAWRLAQRAEDRRTAEHDAAAYLERPDARQQERVRALLASLGR